MKAIWERIEVAIERLKASKLKLKGPASMKVIQATEKSLGVSFPEDVRESLLIHNGQPSSADGLFGSFSLLPAAECAKEANAWNDLDASGEFRTQPGKWKRGWIPLTSDGGGDNHCIDLQGRIILVSHDMKERPVIANCFREWLTLACEDIELEVQLASVPVMATIRADVPTMDDLAKLLGRSINDPVVRSFLGSYKFKVSKYDDRQYYVNRSLGFDLLIENRVVNTVFLYLTGRENHKPYTGMLCQGLLITDNRISAIRKLREPERSGPSESWDRFEIDNIFIRLAYQDNGAGIQDIQLMV